jgi:YaiO family outer membrane protein
MIQLNSYIKSLKAFVLLLCLMGSVSASAQVDTLSLGSDELFAIARNEAFNGSRAKAQIYLNVVLDLSPTYSEVRVFLGRTYAWDDKYDSARVAFTTVIEQDPNYMDAYSALADVEFWDDKPQMALEVTQSGLKRDANNEVLLYKKAKALVALQKETEASLVLDMLLTINPSHEDGKSLQNKIKEASIKNSIALNYNNDLFSDVFDPAHYANLQYGRVTSKGSLFFRGNYSKRFGSTGYQGEVDFYPSLGKGLYMYLNYGYANSTLFPEHRVGAELYFKLPKSFEGSVGLRYLYFSQSSTATLYTATLGKYWRNYWFSVRTFITPNESGVSNSYIFLARRYFADADNFLGLSGGFGFSPDQRFQSIAEEDIITLKSRKIGAEYQRTIGFRWRLNLSYQLAQQQFVFDSSEFIDIHSLSLTARYRF